ncbi:MAG: toll/interleukin-1 receptor domain-containing protein [Gammaproteobacteria bacterium]|nr:toll/interleukin-1 receptor domain-containing protein [Gammaproteobacteria bacterium]
MYSLNDNSADERHLSLLREGVDAWNAWRRQNPDERPRLRRADLGGAVLSGANLVSAQMGGANLRGADLSDADLTSANLSGVDCGGANLFRANLRNAHARGASFLQTDMRSADLRGSDLTGTTFNRADLREADFAEAALLETVFANAQLAGAQGLEHCVHNGPSIVDHRTLQRSPDLSLVFLRGCGLPDTLIEVLPTLFGRKGVYHSVFISYSSSDSEFAHKLYGDLQNAGVRCWFAPEDMKVGDFIRSRIEQAIQGHDKLLLVLSQHSVESAWVEREVEGAFAKEVHQRGIVLFPIRVDNAVLDTPQGWAAQIRQTRHIGDFSAWQSAASYERGLARLLRDLTADAAADA